MYARTVAVACVTRFVVEVGSGGEFVRIRCVEARSSMQMGLIGPRLPVFQVWERIGLRFLGFRHPFFGDPHAAARSDPQAGDPHREPPRPREPQVSRVSRRVGPKLSPARQGTRLGSDMARI
jgi:hypothetical protein